MGGGPLFLLVSVSSYLVSGILVVLVKWLVFVSCGPDVSRQETVREVLVANGLSMLLAGFVLPLAVAFGSLAVAFVVDDSPWALALGTWVVEGSSSGFAATVATGLWLLLTLPAAVAVEFGYLSRRWRSAAIVSAASPACLCWRMNIPSHCVFLAVALWLWRDVWLWRIVG